MSSKSAPRSHVAAGRISPERGASNRGADRPAGRLSESLLIRLATLPAVPSLVAIALPPGPRFVAELTRAWDDGDAVLPVDTRLPLPAAKALLAAMRPEVIVDESGERQHQPGSMP